MAKSSVSKKTTKVKVKKPAYSELDFRPGFWKRHWKEAIIIPVLAFALYWMCLPYGYVLDDQIVISNNQYTKKGLDGIWDIFSNESFAGYFGGQRDLVAGARYRPLSIVTFAIEQEFFGDNTFLRHFINILLYGVVGLMIMRIFSILIPNKENNHWLIAIPFLSAALYILHPVHSEVVANIKGRDEIMTLIGALGALYFALKYLPARNITWLIASGVSMFLGLLAKENAITFLAVIPLTLYFFTNARGKDYVMTLLPSLIASIIYIIIRTNVIGYLLNSGIEIKDLMNNPFVDMTGGERFATIMYTLGEYLRLMVLPHPLTHDYYPYHVPIMNFAMPGTWVSILLYVGLAVAFFMLWKKKSIYAWAIGFFAATLSIVSNFVFPVGTFMNERFIFMPSVAFSLVCGWVLVKHGFNGPKPWMKYAASAVVIILAAGYTFKTYVRVPAWKNSLSLNGQAVLVSKNSARANCFMATALYEEGRDTSDIAVRNQYYEEAMFYAKRALSIHPSYEAANQIYSGLVADIYQKNKDLNYLLTEFEKILTVSPNTEYVYQYMDYMNNRAPAETLINWYYRVAYETMAVKNKAYPAAVQYLKLAEKLAPNDARILHAIGRALYDGGDQVQGTNYLNKAYQINPAMRDM